MAEIIPFPARSVVQRLVNSEPSGSFAKTTDDQAPSVPFAQDGVAMTTKPSTKDRAEAIKNQIDRDPKKGVMTFKLCADVGERMYILLKRHEREKKIKTGIGIAQILHEIGEGKNYDSTKRFPRYALKPGFKYEDRLNRAKKNLARKANRYKKLLEATARLWNLFPEDLIVEVFSKTRFDLSIESKVSYEYEDDDSRYEGYRYSSSVIDRVIMNLIDNFNLITYFNYVRRHQLGIDRIKNEMFAPSNWVENMGLADRSPPSPAPVPRVPILRQSVGPRFARQVRIAREPGGSAWDENAEVIDASVQFSHVVSLCIGPRYTANDVGPLFELMFDVEIIHDEKKLRTFVTYDNDGIFIRVVKDNDLIFPAVIDGIFHNPFDGIILGDEVDNEDEGSLGNTLQHLQETDLIDCVYQSIDRQTCFRWFSLLSDSNDVECLIPNNPNPNPTPTRFPSGTIGAVIEADFRVGAGTLHKLLENECSLLKPMLEAHKAKREGPIRKEEKRYLESLPQPPGAMNKASSQDDL